MRLLDALKENSSLISLNLEGCRLRNEEAEHIANALEHNYTIFELDLSENCKITDGLILNQIEGFLARNRFRLFVFQQSLLYASPLPLELMVKICGLAFQNNPYAQTLHPALDMETKSKNLGFFNRAKPFNQQQVMESEPASSEEIDTQTPLSSTP